MLSASGGGIRRDRDLSHRLGKSLDGGQTIDRLLFLLVANADRFISHIPHDDCSLAQTVSRLLRPAHQLAKSFQHQIERLAQMSKHVGSDRPALRQVTLAYLIHKSEEVHQMTLQSVPLFFRLD